MSESDFALTMQCINGHEYPGPEDSKCPACSEPSRSLLQAVRKECLRSLWWVVPYTLIPPILAYVFVSGGLLLRSPGAELMGIVLTLFWLSGFFEAATVAVGCIHPVTEARARVGTPPKTTAGRGASFRR